MVSKDVINKKKLPRQPFWWQKIDDDIDSHLNSCKMCLSNRIVPALGPFYLQKGASKSHETDSIDFEEKERQAFFIAIDVCSYWLSVCHGLKYHQTHKYKENLVCVLYLTGGNNLQFTSKGSAAFLQHTEQFEKSVLKIGSNNPPVLQSPCWVQRECFPL